MNEKCDSPYCPGLPGEAKFYSGPGLKLHSICKQKLITKKEISEHYPDEEDIPEYERPRIEQPFGLSVAEAARTPRRGR